MTNAIMRPGTSIVKRYFFLERASRNDSKYPLFELYKSSKFKYFR